MIKIVRIQNGWKVKVTMGEYGDTRGEWVFSNWAEVIDFIEAAKDRHWV